MELYECTNVKASACFYFVGGEFYVINKTSWGLCFFSLFFFKVIGRGRRVDERMCVFSNFLRNFPMKWKKVFFWEICENFHKLPTVLFNVQKGQKNLLNKSRIKKNWRNCHKICSRFHKNIFFLRKKDFIKHSIWKILEHIILKNVIKNPGIRKKLIKVENT